jgi:hypothetical protein
MIVYGRIDLMHLCVSAAATLLALSAGAHAELHKFAQPGTLTIDGAAARAATLQAACSPERHGGAISIEFVVPEANTRKDFDYDDFEGPDAVGGDKVPARIGFSSRAGVTRISHPAGGWYAPEPPDSFMFGISQPSHHRDALAKLLGAIGSDAGSLVWEQDGFDRPSRRLVATFEMDAAAAGRLHAAIASCLPPDMPKNPN